MSETIIAKYEELVKKVDAAKIRKYNNKELTLHYFSKGDLYDGRLMLVGRAVNGWTKSWIHGQHCDEESPRIMLEELYKESMEKPLAWVNYYWGRNEKNEQGEKMYNTARSSFWQLARQLLHKLTPEGEWDETRWAEKLAWTNLYKVAPFEGGNPNEPLCRAQLEICREILRYEIEKLKPQKIVFVTDLDWFRDFAEVVEQTGVRYVVCKRPEFSSPENMATEIIKTLK